MVQAGCRCALGYGDTGNTRPIGAPASTRPRLDGLRSTVPMLKHTEWLEICQAICAMPPTLKPARSATSPRIPQHDTPTASPAPPVVRNGGASSRGPATVPVLVFGSSLTAVGVLRSLGRARI